MGRAIGLGFALAGAMMVSSCGGGSGSEGPKCNNTCSAQGATQCSGSQIQTCTADANGCLAWSVPANCTAGLACYAPLAKCTCDTCPSAGATQCSGADVQTCTAGAGGCLAWSAPSVCPVHMSCSATGGKCACNNTCAMQGSTQCSGLQIQTCNADANGCLTWSAPAACPGNLSCNPTQRVCIDRPVLLSWDPNRESGVNKAGGGYQVSISGQSPLDVPYVSGPAAPTSTSARLPPGSHSVTVRAYAALDAQGGSTGSTSAPSQTLIVNVP